ncbi:MAG TPA: hypothetical protein VLS89_16035, partial [Candidatus Nanopelagicales bacterium]|nr:hypothetical protein [Candidatus Nanopelagicales bacterium]
AGGATTQIDAAFDDSRLVLARYDGCNLEVIRPSACSAQGRYTFKPSTVKMRSEHRVLHTRAQLAAEAPLLAAEIGGSLRTSEGVGLVLAESGFWEGYPPVVTKRDLQGDPGCVESATHFVQVAAVGAYEAYRDRARSLDARAALPFFGAAGGGTAAGQSSFARAGDVNACFQGNLNLCAAPLRLVLAPISATGTDVVCPAGQVPDRRGGCMDYADPRTTFSISIGVQGRSCGDLVGDCEYGVEVWVANRKAAILRGPQDSARMAPVQIQRRFVLPELEQGLSIKLFDRDPFQDDFLGSCSIRKTWAQLVPYVHRAREGQPAQEEVVSCGARDLLIRFEPGPPLFDAGPPRGWTFRPGGPR